MCSEVPGSPRRLPGGCVQSALSFYIFCFFSCLESILAHFGPLSQTTVPSSVFAPEAQIEPEQGAALFVLQIEVN